MKGRMNRDWARRRRVLDRQKVRAVLRTAFCQGSQVLTERQRAVLGDWSSHLEGTGSLVDQMMVGVRMSREPRASSVTRVRRRCAWTGRSRGMMRSWHMSRITFRSKALAGHLAGVRKSSW